MILELLKNSWFLLHIHLTDLQHTCLEITKKQQRSYDPSNLSKTIQNQNHQYLLITRANSPPKKVENDVPGPPQLSPKMLPKAPGTPQDPADLQGTPHFEQRIRNIDMFQSQLLTLNSEQLAQSSARFTCCFQVIAVAKNVETGGGGVSP